MKKNVMIAGVMMMSVATARADWFDMLDKDVSGTVSKAEWLASYRAEAKKKGTEFSEEKPLVWFAARDQNGDGVITREEFDATKKK